MIGRRRSVAAIAAAILAFHLAGFALLLSAPSSALLGLGVSAYVLGVRHAFDADHIAAIDNTTRKLIGDGARPLGAGFFFSLGHSTVVFALACLFALGFTAISGQVEDDGSTLHAVSGWIGTLVSGGFLYLVAALNAAVLLGIVRVLREMREGRCDEAELERQLECRGPIGRLGRRFTGAIKAPWQLYPIGLLFGLGFDTATEVALLFLTAGAAGGGLPFGAVICLPLLFAAGMTLLDTVNGACMSAAYGWAATKPTRRIFFNLTITVLSILIALVIGTIELLALLAEQLHLQGAFWSWLENFDLNMVGFVIVGLSAMTWLAAFLAWRFGRLEERWSRPAD